MAINYCCNMLEEPTTHPDGRYEAIARQTSGPGGSHMTQDQAETLMMTLEHTRDALQHYIYTLQTSSDKALSATRQKSWWGRHCWPRKRRWLYRYITVVTVSLQLLNLLILTLLDAWPKPQQEMPYIIASSVTMIFLQLINLFFLIMASGRLVKQFYRNSVNSLFLAQTYGATILLFAGLYTLTYRIQKHSWRFVNENLNDDPVQVFNLYAKFLFYSISTATLCGSDNVLPDLWYNCLFAGFQMLLSFCYFASILGSTMCHENTKLPLSVSTAHLKPGMSSSHCEQCQDKHGPSHSTRHMSNVPATHLHESTHVVHTDGVSVSSQIPLLSNGPSRHNIPIYSSNGSTAVPLVDRGVDLSYNQSCQTSLEVVVVNPTNIQIGDALPQ